MVRAWKNGDPSRNPNYQIIPSVGLNQKGKDSGQIDEEYAHDFIYQEIINQNF